MIPRELDAWLDHAERLHPKAVDLSLERIGTVLARLGLAAPPFPVLTVGGTNGKGSCVAFLEAALLASGRRVAAYTSPHLVRYGERVRIGGAQLDDAAHAAAFAEVEAVRGGVPLTYFEFGTAAALCAMRTAAVEVAVLEVGLGGRLDAVNAVDPLVSVVTSVGLDHVELLGPDRDAIGAEKAGIFRRGRPAVCGDRAPPPTLLARAQAIGARLSLLGRDFEVRRQPAGWDLVDGARALHGLPAPALAGAFQYDNAACALVALDRVRERLPVDDAALARGLRTVRNPARCERFAGPVEVVLDVAHNPHAARALAAELAATRPAGRTLAVFAMLADKDARGVVDALAESIDAWYAAGLAGPRGRTAGALAAAIVAVRGDASVRTFADVVTAHDAAQAAALPGDRIVVLGSFRTVGALLERGLYCR